MKQRIDKHQHAKLKKAKVWMIGPYATYMIPATMGELIEWVTINRNENHDLRLLQCAITASEPIDALVPLCLQIKEKNVLSC